MRRVFVGVVAFGVACSTSESPENAEPESELGTEVEADSGLIEEEPEPIEPLGSAYVITVAAMRRTPSSDKKITDPDKPKKRIANWVATLHQGETVELLERQDDWARARASDDTEGWIQQKYLASADSTKLATLHDEAKVFKRPDLLTLNASRTIKPATLLFRLKDKDQFSEVKNGYRTDWVLTDKLNDDEREVEASKLYAKARWLKEQRDDGYEPLMELIKAQFSDTRTVEAIEVQQALLEEAAEAEAEARAEEKSAAGAGDEG